MSEVYKSASTCKLGDLVRIFDLCLCCRYMYVRYSLNVCWQSPKPCTSKAVITRSRFGSTYVCVDVADNPNFIQLLSHIKCKAVQ